MFLIYTPDGGEPQRLKYLPNKLMSAEREVLERRTGQDFSDFTKAVLNGSSLCRRALLWVLLKREHPTLRFEDVDFAWDELRLEYSKQEWQATREKALEQGGPDVAAALEAIDREIETAIDEETVGEGKAVLPIAE